MSIKYVIHIAILLATIQSRIHLLGNTPESMLESHDIVK